jgi:uncharacterized protein YjaG (DUF416 family)
VTTVLDFDEGNLVSLLTQLQPPHRILFALGCAEQLIPTYQSFVKKGGVGDLTRVSSLMNEMWSSLEGGGSGTDWIMASEDLIETMRDIDNSADKNGRYAEDALAAVAYALRTCATLDPQEGAYAACQVYEALDQKALDSGAAYETVLSDPIVQRELLRQNDDVNRLLELRGAVNLLEERRRYMSTATDLTR